LLLKISGNAIPTAGQPFLTNRMVGESKTCGQVDVLDEKTPVGPEQWWYCAQGRVKNLDKMLVARSYV
jgi:hypothetical protein